MDTLRYVTRAVKVVLTFDDGPHEAGRDSSNFTLQVLAALRASCQVPDDYEGFFETSEVFVRARLGAFGRVFGGGDFFVGCDDCTGIRNV